MKKTIKTNDRVKKYSAMAGAFLATGAVNAQIQYTDVNPDQVVDQNNSPFALDLDGDMVDDMNFMVGFASGTYYNGLINYTGYYAVASGASNRIVLDTSNSYAAMLSSGSFIGSSAMLSSGSQMLGAVVNYTGLATGSIQAGNFLGMTDGYMGVEFDISGATHYGWVRLDVDANATSITIKDHAYNMVADTGLDAGEDGLGLTDVDMINKVHFKPMLNKVIINVTPDLLGSEISVVDLSGKAVSKTTASGVNTTISYDDIDSGIYMIVVTSDKASISKKVYIR
jgi:hypothetical protein